MTTLIRWLLIGDLEVDSEERCKMKRSTQEVILSQGEASPYDPRLINSIVLRALSEAEPRIKEFLAMRRELHVLQLSIRPILAGESRPSFGLSMEAINALAKMGVTLDFDPY